MFNYNISFLHSQESSLFQQVEPKQSIKSPDKTTGGGEYKRQTLYDYNIYLSPNEQIYLSSSLESDIMKSLKFEQKYESKEQKQQPKTEPVRINFPIREAIIPKDFVCDFTGLSTGHSPHVRYDRKSCKFLPLKRAGLEMFETKVKNSRCNLF